MEDKFLGDNLLVNIERKIAESFDSDLILNDLGLLRLHRMQFFFLLKGKLLKVLIQI
jgi:hypothetical protein